MTVSFRLSQSCEDLKPGPDCGAVVLVLTLTFLRVGALLPGFRKDAGAEDGHQGELPHLLSVSWKVQKKEGEVRSAWR